MSCKVERAEAHRKAVPTYSDHDLKTWLNYSTGEGSHTKGSPYTSPEWCLFRALVIREARKRGISLGS